MAVAGWALTVVAAALALGSGATAYYMARAIDWGGRGMLGVFALLFPLHLLAVTPVAVAVALLAWWAGAPVAVGLAAAAAVALVVMALWPTFSTWRRARQLGITLSLRRYVANARRPNFGGARPERTVRYATTGEGTELLLDAWPTTAPGPRPGVVRIHGGGWTSGSRGEQGFWNEWLNDRGYHVFDIEYRLPPPARWEDEVADVKTAMRWVAARATDLGVDATRVAVMGNSAGGNLALLAAYAASAGDDDIRAACVVNIYGPADLTLFYRSSGSGAYVRDALRRYIGGPPEQHPGRYRAVSPVDHVSRVSPPTITVLGQSDRIVPVDQTEALDASLAAAGVVHETVLLPGCDHGFDTNWGGFGTQIAQRCIERFLAEHLD